MKWVDASPVSKTGFEQMMLREFGLNVDLSNNAMILALGAVVVLTAIHGLVWSRRM